MSTEITPMKRTRRFYLHIKFQRYKLCFFRSINTHMHAHTSIRIFFLNQFCARFTGFWAWYENIEKNKVYEYKASFVRKEKSWKLDKTSRYQTEGNWKKCGRLYDILICLKNTRNYLIYSIQVEKVSFMRKPKLINILSRWLSYIRGWFRR